MKINLGRTNFTAKDIAALADGTLIGECGCKIEITSVCTDSKEIDDKTLFVAMSGQRRDGHDYVLAAISEGCPAVLCERIPDGCLGEDIKVCFILVDNTVAALGRIAEKCRRELSAKIIGVTGSVGKTTTKEMVSSALSLDFKVGKTEGNYNSLIGMPLSLMQTEKDVEIAVYEMGMSDIGEIDRMSRIARPDLAIITNVGSSHLEMLGSRENIAAAKLEIVNGMKDGSVLILNGDEPLLCGDIDFKGSKYYVSMKREDADFYVSNIRHSKLKTLFDITYRGKKYADMALPFTCKHGVHDAAYAFAVGMLLGASEEGIRRGIFGYKNASMRWNIYDFHSLTLIEDCYNASPESMRAAVDLLSGYASLGENIGRRKIAILGDMLDLGRTTVDKHRKIGKYLAEHGVDKLFTFGELAENIAKGAIENGLCAENVVTFKDISNPEAMGDMVLGEIKDRDILLFKASRGIAEERIINYIKTNYTKKLEEN